MGLVPVLIDWPTESVVLSEGGVRRFYLRNALQEEIKIKEGKEEKQEKAREEIEV